MTDHLDYATEDSAGSRSPRSWPSVVGALAVAFAVLNILGALCSAWLSVFVPAAFLAREGYSYDVPWLSWDVAGSLAEVAILMLLVVGGLMFIRRKPAAVALTKTWAVLAVIHAIIGTLLHSTTPSNNEPLLRILGIIPVGIVVGFLPVFGPPVLFWIWLSRESVEWEVSQWQARFADSQRVENDDRVHAP